MSGTIKIPGKRDIPIELDNLTPSSPSDKHIQRMIIAFLTCDTLLEDALQKCNIHSLQILLKKKVGEEYMKWNPDMSQPYMNLSKVTNSCNNKLAEG